MSKVQDAIDEMFQDLKESGILSKCPNGDGPCYCTGACKEKPIKWSVLDDPNSFEPKDDPQFWK